MRKSIARAIEGGHDPNKIVVVTGAFHVCALTEPYRATDAFSDSELDQLSAINTQLTLMPYSNYRLSTRSGYGAGNEAPRYFETMWACMEKADFSQFPALYLSEIATYVRGHGTPCSAAQVIEAVYLANTLAALHDASAPARKDLRDAAVTCLAGGDFSVIAEAVAATEIGTAIGALPEGVSRTSIQTDFYNQLKNLKLDKYKSAVAMDLDLDLRENRRVQSQEAAFLDLRRSSFLHRLRVLAISFARNRGAVQDSATWAEHWTLCWSAEAEIELVESVLRGETIEIAVAFVFNERLAASATIASAALVVREACECGMMGAMEMARAALQQLAVDNASFIEIVTACDDIGRVIGFGDIRGFDTSHLEPLLQQLALRGILLLTEAAWCDNSAAKSLIAAMGTLNRIALDHSHLVDDGLWIKSLSHLANLDDRNPIASGYACALLLERNEIQGQDLAKEVSRRLSPGIDADLGAGWFEGLSMRNHYALLARMGLWEALDSYVESLDAPQFSRALVFLRRAFGNYNPNEKRHICENFGEIWGVGREDASDVLSRELDVDEVKVLADLNDFDFGDI